MSEELKEVFKYIVDQLKIDAKDEYSKGFNEALIHVGLYIAGNYYSTNKEKEHETNK